MAMALTSLIMAGNGAKILKPKKRAYSIPTSSAGTILSREHVCNSYQKLEITAYKVLNMDMFSYKK